jgi:hypothetical protein
MHKGLVRADSAGWRTAATASHNTQTHTHTNLKLVCSLCQACYACWALAVQVIVLQPLRHEEEQAVVCLAKLAKGAEHLEQE